MAKKLSNQKCSLENNESGMALFICLNLIAAIFAITFAFMLAGLYEIRGAERFENRLAAFHLAEGAVDKTIATLRTNASYAGLSSTAATGGRINGTYSSTLSSPTSSVYSIVGTGNVTTAGGAYAAQTQTVTAVVNLAPASIYKYALFSNGSITMSGNAKTDSYNSSIAPYSSAGAGSSGDIGTNSSLAGYTMLSGNATVNGKSYIGPLGNIATAYQISGNAVINGTKTMLSATETLSPVTIPGGLASGGALAISGNSTVTLPAGTYYYSSINVSGNGKLLLSGAATVYVSGTVSIAGNGIGTAQSLPPNLTLKVQGNSVGLSGNGNFYGAIYAPSAAIAISGNGSIYGSMIGSSFSDSGNGAIHYDQALNPSSGSTNSGQLRSWQAT